MKRKDKALRLFSMDKVTFNSRPCWFWWGYPHKTTKSQR